MGHLSPRDLIEGTWRRAPFPGDIKDVLIKALEMVACFHTGPTFGEHRDTILYLRFFERGKNSIFRDIFMRSLRHIMRAL